MATPSVDSRINNDYAISKDISTSNTRKRYNNSENKTKRKYNNKNKNYVVKNGGGGDGGGGGGIGGNYSKKPKQPENSNSPRSIVNNNPFLVPAEATPRDDLHTPKTNSSSKKPRVDKKGNNVFLASSTSVGEYGRDSRDSRDGRDSRDWKYGKESDHKPNNMFIQNSMNASSSSSFSKRNNDIIQPRNDSSSLGNKASNYFIHNSKIQMNRRQTDESSFRHSSTSLETLPTPPTTVNINITDVEQFPSLGGGGGGGASTSAQIPSPTNIWTKNKLKIKAEASVSVSAGTAAAASTGNAEVIPAVEVNPADKNTTPITTTLYKAKTVTATTNILSRDNIFLGAFMKITESPSIDIASDDNYNSGNSADSNIHIATSILVDNCDTSYDRFYK